ncbi:MAG: hypothetical protein ABDH37_00725 [Candidatus Hydrothermales bacterium]
MLAILIISLHYLASIGYKGLGVDFSIVNEEIWVSFPIENKVLNYSTFQEFSINEPTVILYKKPFTYVVSNLEDKLYTFENNSLYYSINIPEGDYVSGCLHENQIYLLSRTPANIVKINENFVFTVMQVPSYKPIDFKPFKNEFYILDRKASAPSLRILKINEEGTIVGTLLDLPGVLGGGFEIAEINGNKILLLTNALMGRIYIYFLDPLIKIDSFGSYGDSIFEFKTPTKIKYINQKIYILNQRNSRIDIYTFDNFYTPEIIVLKENPFDNIKVSKEEIFFDLKLPEGNYDLNIFSIDGRKILELDNFITEKGYLSFRIPFSFKRGVYFIMLKEKQNKFLIRKVFKIK